MVADSRGVIVLPGSDHEDREEEYTHDFLGFNQSDIAWDKWLNSVKYVSHVLCGTCFLKLRANTDATKRDMCLFSGILACTAAG